MEIKTLEDARKYVYGVSVLTEQKYKEGFCAYEVWDNWSCHQCKRKNGHGINGLYCKQHAKKLGME